VYRLPHSESHSDLDGLIEVMDGSGCYPPNGEKPFYLNDLSSPDNPSSRRYIGKLIKKIKPVPPIDGSVHRHCDSSDLGVCLGYVLNASRIADRRMVLAGYRLADLLIRLGQN